MASPESPGGHKKLGQLAATAICGNDITSSCLYVSALATMAAAHLSPFSLLIVAAVLYLFRKIYAEVVGALPLNGGAYNALLNTTSKSRASVAACLTLLSYMATAVISAIEAVHYVRSLWDGLPEIAATIGLLAVFMILTIVGITESAKVAIGIFITHLVTLGLLLIAGLVWFISNDAHLDDNFDFQAPIQRQMIISGKMLDSKALSTTEKNEVIGGIETQLGNGTLPESLKVYLEEKGVELAGEEVAPVEGDPHRWRIGTGGLEVLVQPESADDGGHEEERGLAVLTETTLLVGLFFGFCAAMLGISGFESSANFVEEQAPGVFPKTLRNMWIAVSILNPSMAFLTLAVLPVDEVGFHKNHLLAHLGDLTAGGWLKFLISIDAALVLSGAVLTSYVGVTGLVHRMTLDRCLPQYLLKKNKKFGTTHRIVIAFFILAVSVLLVTGGALEALAGVYTLSFLSVMVLFAVGNMLLKVRRRRLPRPDRASWVFVVVATVAVAAALVGIAIDQPEYFMVFLYYFLPALAVVMVMLWRVGLLKTVLGIVQYHSKWVLQFFGGISKGIEKKIDQINSQQVVFFTRGDMVDNLRRAVEYVRDNEQTKRIKVVTVAEDVSKIPDKIEHDLQVLDEAYPNIDLEFVKMEGTFSPALIDRLSGEWKIPKNLMFIGSHGEKFKYDQATLGGVRLII
ncbi:MAG: APC family permease [Planctomycetota bacterium]|nr:APC family permease [Planctomycetota bacterium]